jgi:long-chain acyl-CoA synthetase
MTSGADRLEAVLDGHEASGTGRLAIREEGREWSYGSLAAASRAIGAALGAEGVEPGARVALMLPNSGAFVASFFGIARAGGVIAPFNVRYREQEIRFYVEDARAAVVLASPELTELVTAALAPLRAAPTVLAVDAGAGVQRVARGRVEPVPAAASDRESPLLQQYTSGSTGTPKRVLRTHGQLLYELARLQRCFGLGSDDRFLGAAPFSHVNGMVRTMMTSMYVGGTLFPLPEFQRRPVLDVLSRERITYFGGVPYMYAILADTPLRGPVDLAALRTAFSASAPLTPEDNRRFAQRYGVFVRQLYGSTETGTISVNLDPHPERFPESVGTPLDGVTVEVLDDAGNALGPGEEGELAIASPAAIRAYDGNPEANEASFRNGFYLSGDLGHKDAEGRITLTGRKKFLINRGGYKVNPLEVERAIRSHPAVREVVVLGAPSRHGDEVVRAVVVAAAGCAPGEIVEHCRPLIADFKIPSIVEFRDELPKTPTGKVLRKEL